MIVSLEQQKVEYIVCWDSFV